MKSFSNVIFDNLNIPIVKGESNITVHQLLRLMYIDQKSPTSSLFYYEHFDSQFTRETTSDLLLGIYDDELYQNKKKSLDISKTIDDVKSEIKALKAFFTDPLLLEPANIEAKIDNAEKEVSEIEVKILDLKLSDASSSVKIDKFEFQKLAYKITEQRGLVISLKERINKINYEVTDNEFFINSLHVKLQALRNSIRTREILNEFPLAYCPECLTEINTKDIDPTENRCKLCKEEIDSIYGTTQARRIEQEIGFQITESTSIQKKLVQGLDSLTPRLKKEVAILQSLQKQYDRVVLEVRTSEREQIEILYSQKGFIEGEIVQFRTMHEQAQYYQSMVEKRDLLIREKDSIDAFVIGK